MQLFSKSKKEERMKILKKISDFLAKLGEIVCMISIAALVVVIVIELMRRNLLNQSFRGTIEVCGIAFLWMAFIGLIPLYHDGGLMRLDFLVARTKGGLYELLYFIDKAVSLMLGVVMVVAFVAQYPYVNTRFYSTFKVQIPYTVQYIPMAVAGCYIAFDTVRQVAEHIIGLTGKRPEKA